MAPPPGPISGMCKSRLDLRLLKLDSMSIVVEREPCEPCKLASASRFPPLEESPFILYEVNSDQPSL